MQDQNDQSPNDADLPVPAPSPAQLYTKDDEGNFVPVIVEPADSDDDSEGAMFLAMQRRHAGPLPSADTFRGYGEVLPSAPERIMRMAEIEQAATHKALQTHQKDERFLVSQGQWMGFISMIVALGGGIWMAYLGHIAFACALVSPAVLTPIMRFYFKGKHDAEKSREPNEPNEAG